MINTKEVLIYLIFLLISFMIMYEWWSGVKVTGFFTIPLHLWNQWLSEQYFIVDVIDKFLYYFQLKCI